MRKFRCLSVWVYGIAVVLGMDSSSMAQLSWSQATSAAPWSARRNHAAAANGGRMWIFSGRDGGGNFSDVWSSTNGASWVQATSTAPWTMRRGAIGLAFDGRIWLMGGHDGGFRSDVWHSVDGVNWTMATGSAGWSGREDAGGTTFGGRMWVAGGWTGGSAPAEAWYSTNGASWTLAVTNPGWTHRQFPTLTDFDNRLWLAAGWADAGLMNDVWSTADGVSWSRNTASAGWPVRVFHGSVAYGGRLWVLGGWSGGGAGGHRDAWYSTNGANWTQDPTTPGWPGRQSPTPVVFDGKIWVFGGLDTTSAVKSDVWSGGFDADTDGIADGSDNCPNTPNAGQADADTDGRGDVCDNCPNAANSGQEDADSDGAGDACDTCPGFDDNVDADSDGAPDGCDDCPGFDDNLDCNGNNNPDGCDISGPTSDDCDTNGVPDECEGSNWIGGDGDAFTDSAQWDPTGTPTAGATLLNAGATDNRCVLPAGQSIAVCNLAISANGSGRQILLLEDNSLMRIIAGGMVGSAGDVVLRNAELAGGVIDIDGGTLSGEGAVSADVSNAGLVEGRPQRGLALSLAGASFDNTAAGMLRARLGSLILIQTPALTQAGAVEIRPSGAIGVSGPLENAAGGSIALYGGVLGAMDVTNDDGATIEGYGDIDGDLLNEGWITVIADMQIVGNLVNNGTIAIQNGVLTVTGGVSGSGVIIGGFGG